MVVCDADVSFLEKVHIWSTPTTTLILALVLLVAMCRWCGCLNLGRCTSLIGIKLIAQPAIL